MVKSAEDVGDGLLSRRAQSGGLVYLRPATPCILWEEVGTRSSFTSAFHWLAARAGWSSQERFS